MSQLQHKFFAIPVGEAFTLKGTKISVYTDIYRKAPTERIILDQDFRKVGTCSYVPIGDEYLGEVMFDPAALPSERIQTLAEKKIALETVATIPEVTIPETVKVDNVEAPPPVVKRKRGRPKKNA